MLPRRRQLLSRIPARPSFAGRTVVERLRSTAFALLGVTTAMALGLVALVSQQSWPYLPVSPIPGYEAKQGKVESAVAMAPALIAPVSRGRTASVDHPAAGAGGRAPAPVSTDLSNSRQLHTPAHSPSRSPEPGGGPPSAGATPVKPPPPAPSPPPTASAPAPAPAPSPAPTPAPAAAAATAQPAVTSTVPGRGHAYGKSKTAGAPAAPGSKSSYPASAPPAVAPTAPETVEPETVPPAPVPSDVPGRGHAYGHFK